MIGWAFIFAMVGVLPWMAFRSAQRINSGARPLPPRSALHFNTIVTLAILLAVSVFVARSEPLWIFRPFHPSWRCQMRQTSRRIRSVLFALGIRSSSWPSTHSVVSQFSKRARMTRPTLT